MTRIAERPRALVLSVTASVLAQALWGCSLLGLYEDPPVEVPANATEACTRMSQALCDELLDCCPAWTGDDADACVDGIAGDCALEYSALVDDDLVEFDPYSWQPCLDDIADFFGSCSQEPFPNDGACGALWVGQRGRGESCGSSEECAPGLDCYSTCVDPLTLPRDGEPCLEEACEGASCLLLCAAEHYCDEEGVCRPFGEQGDPCEILDPESTDDCGQGLMCSDDLLCVPDLEAGADCTTGRECRSYVCAEGRCAEGDDQDPTAYCDLGL